MSPSARFPVEPWAVRETALDLTGLARTESLFALSNGHIGVRANLDEGEPHGLPGSYLNSVHDLRPMPYAETAYGDPAQGQTVLNVTNGKLIRLLVDDEPFDVRYGTLTSHSRRLDFRAGLLERAVEWTSPATQQVKIRSTRMVSLTHRAIMAICYEVEPLRCPARVVVQSELVANEELPPAETGDPRVATALTEALVAQDGAVDGTVGYLLHRTRRSGLVVGAAMDHLVAVHAADGSAIEAGLVVSSAGDSDWVRTTATVLLEPGQRLRLVKWVGYGWSAQRSVPALRDQVAAAITAARHTGWEGLLAEQRDYLDEFWAGADVEVEGDPELQQAVRFGLFHVLQASARGEQRPIAAKGLTGSGYDGHTFWDTEAFVLPVLTHTAPTAAADALRWRASTLPSARERAHQLGLRGAAFPWRTITGEEAGGYWPAGTAAFHLNADIADAVLRYTEATGDETFAATTGLELLVETARLWRSLGHHDLQGRFRLDGVTGPDEYSAIADNNVFTNMMARRNLRGAADAAARYPAPAGRLGVDTEEMASWRDAADGMFIPYDPALGVHPQAEGFTSHQVWDFADTPAALYPLLLHFPYFDLYRKQVCKQADLTLAMHLCGEAFTDEQKLRNFDYYERLTVRDSSLSAATQAVMAAEVGHLDLAYDYAAEAALMDLHDLNHNTRDGLHLASLAGAWLSLVAGFGGLRGSAEGLRFQPRLPAGLDRLSLGLLWRGARLRVSFDAGQATYTLLDADGEITVRHHGAPLVVRAGHPVSRPIPPPPERTPPEQPPGRAPARRGGTDRA